MDPSEATLIPLLLILFLGLFVPEMFKRLKFPWVTSLIIIGAILGPNALNYVQPNEIISFFGFLGLTFLMFMAGLETNMEYLKSDFSKIGIMTVFNAFIPCALGVGIARWFGYGWTEAAILGTIFASSSVAIVFPILKGVHLFKQESGQVIMASVIFQDILSLVALAVIFQTINPITDLPLGVYFMVLLLSVFGLKAILPAVSKFVLSDTWFFQKTDHEEEVQLVMIILITVLLYFSLLGVHPILGSFLAGIILSGVISSTEIVHKFHALAYGLFIPVFFFIVGTEMDMSIFASYDPKNFIIPVIVIGLIGSKFISGYLGARAAALESQPSVIFGVVSTTQLSTTLAATYTAAAAGLIDNTLVTAILILSVVTTISSPLVTRWYVQKTGMGMNGN